MRKHRKIATLAAGVIVAAGLTQLSAATADAEPPQGIGGTTGWDIWLLHDATDERIAEARAELGNGKSHAEAGFERPTAGRARTLAEHIKRSREGGGEPSSAPFRAGAKSSLTTEAAKPPQIFVQPAPIFEYSDVDECRTRGTGVVNHYAYCQITYLDMGHFRYRNNGTVRILGQITGRATLVGYASYGTRQVQFELVVDQVAATGDLANGQLEVRFRCSGQPTPEQCQIDQGAMSVSPPTEWNSTPHQFYELGSAMTGGYGEDLLGYGDFWQTWSATTDRGENSGYNDDRRESTRCDSALVMQNATPHACVFNGVVPWIKYTRTDPRVAAAAEHIWDAFYNPDITVPLSPGKQIPGNVFAGDSWLHRSTDPAVKSANRNKATTVCGSVWPGYAEDGSQCDEYPFASVVEGAALGNGNYSVRPIDGPQNGAAGTDLGNFYNFDRILNQDEFGVGIY